MFYSVTLNTEPRLSGAKKRNPIMTTLASQPFHQAAKDGNVQLLRRASKKELNKQDHTGWTAVHWAAWNGNAELVKAVLDKGADVNAYDNNGSTALHVAAQYGNLESLEHLIERGSNVWALDDQGRTAATVARNNNKLEAAQYLDTQASYWELQSTEKAQKLKAKAVDQLKKRTSTKRQSFKGGGSSGTLSSSKDNAAGNSSENDGSLKRKVTAEDALRANFELRPPEAAAAAAAEEGSRTQKGEDDGNDSFPQLAPIPKTQTAILLNTLHAIPPSTPPPDTGNSDAVLANGQMELEGDLILTNQVTQNDSTLATFLHSLDLQDSIELLHREKMDLESLSFCEEKDLISIGIPLGHRKKILHAIHRRKEVLANPGSIVDTDL